MNSSQMFSPNQFKTAGRNFNNSKRAVNKADENVGILDRIVSESTIQREDSEQQVLGPGDHFIADKDLNMVFNADGESARNLF